MRRSSYRVRSLILALVFAACSTTDEATPVGLGDGCVFDSDCKDPLVCAFARCHGQCEASRDCPTGQRCVHGTGNQNVCQLLDERACEYRSDCPLGQLCGVDGQCRDECFTDVDCVSEQLCVQHTCADPAELVDGALPTTKPTEGVPCLYDSECPASMHCRMGSCVFDCVADADCNGGEVCIDHLCRSADAGAECTPGEQPACACPDGGAGFRVCGKDAKFGPCIPCSGGLGGAGGAVSSASVGGSGGTVSSSSGGGMGVGGAVASSSSAAASTGVGGSTSASSSAAASTGVGGSTSASSSAAASTGVGGSTSASSSAVASSSSGTSAASSSAVASSSSSGTSAASSSAVASSSSSTSVASSSAGVASSGSSGPSTTATVGTAVSSSGPATTSAGVGGFGGGITIKDAATELAVVDSPDLESLLYLEALPDVAPAFVGVDGDGAVALAGALSSGVEIDGQRLATDGDDVIVARLGASRSIQSFPSPGVQYIEAAALDDAGTLVLAVGCAFCSGLDLGRGTPESTTLVRAYDPAGHSLWQVPITSTRSARAAAVVADGDDGFLVAGSFGGALDVGGTRLAARGAQDLYLLRFDHGGGLTWSAGLDAGPSVSVTALAVGAGGSILVGGSFEGRLDLGTGVLESAGGRDAFVASLGGRAPWSRRWGGAFDDGVSAIAVAPDGVVAIAGAFEGAADFTDGARRVRGRGDAFAALLDGDGVVQWTRTLGGPREDAATAVRFDGSGDVVVAGYTGGGFDFAAGPMTAAGGTDAFVAKIERSGAPRSTRLFGNAANQFVEGLSTGPADEVWLAISSSAGAVDLGLGPMAGSSFLVALAP